MQKLTLSLCVALRRMKSVSEHAPERAPKSAALLRELIGEVAGPAFIEGKAVYPSE
jgi:hypothetical protein